MYNEDVCNRFHENPNINPITGKRLIYGKKPYLEFVEKCHNTVVKSTSKNLIKIEPEEVNQITIPEEVVFENFIVNSENLQTLVSFCSTNKRFQKLCQSDNFWKHLYEKYYGKTGMIDVVKFTTWYDLFKLCFALSKLIKYPGFHDQGFKIKELYIQNSLSDEEDTTQLPPEIGVLINLKKIEFIETGIDIIPKEIGNLTNLKSLIIDIGGIKEIPKELCDLTGLGSLWFPDNEIINIPSDISKLVNLVDLNLSWNKIKVIPKKLSP